MRVELVWDRAVEVFDTPVPPDAALVRGRLGMARTPRGWALVASTKSPGLGRDQQRPLTLATLDDTRRLAAKVDEPQTLVDLCDGLWCAGAVVDGQVMELERVDVDGWTLWEAPSGGSVPVPDELAEEWGGDA